MSVYNGAVAVEKGNTIVVCMCTYINIRVCAYRQRGDGNWSKMGNKEINLPGGKGWTFVTVASTAGGEPKANEPQCARQRGLSGPPPFSPSVAAANV